MAFFSRPNLDNIQFKQVSGDTLTLSGTTQIVGTLEFKDNHNNFIPIEIENPQNEQVLTFINGKLVLEDSAGSSGGTNYHGNSPVTNDVGGWEIGQELTGKSLHDIIEQLLAPPEKPILIENFSHEYMVGFHDIENYQSFNWVGSGNQVIIREVGTLVENFYITSTFNRGEFSSLCPSASTTTVKGNILNHTISPFGWTGVGSNGLILSNTWNNQYEILQGANNNVITVSVVYGAGSRPKNASCKDYDGFDDLLVGGTLNRTFKINGILPYFYGKSTTKPTNLNVLISNSQTEKVVEPSNTSIQIMFNANNEYIWFAVPRTTIKFKHYVGGNTPNNNGTIPGIPVGLFQAPIEVSNINSPDGFWDGMTYDFYVSSYPTSTIESGIPYYIEFRRT